MQAYGTHFRTKDYDDTTHATCDSMVTATFLQQSVAGRGDQNPIGDTLTYVGYITDIISLNYGHQVQIVLLRVQWYRAIVEEDASRNQIAHPHNAVRPRDESGFHTVNTSHLVPIAEEPFTMVDHVTQATLCPIDDDPDNDGSNWSLIIPLESKFAYLSTMMDTFEEEND